MERAALDEINSSEVNILTFTIKFTRTNGVDQNELNSLVVVFTSLICILLISINNLSISNEGLLRFFRKREKLLTEKMNKSTVCLLMLILFNKTFYGLRIRKGHNLEQRLKSFKIGTKNNFQASLHLFKRKIK